jgi:hypothetical protein
MECRSEQSPAIVEANVTVKNSPVLKNVAVIPDIQIVAVGFVLV